MSRYQKILITLGAVVIGGFFLSILFFPKTESIYKALSIGYFYAVTATIVFLLVHKLMASKLTVLPAGQQLIVRSLLYTIAISFAYLTGFVFQTIVLLPFQDVQNAVIDNAWKGFVYMISSLFKGETSEEMFSSEFQTISITFFAMIFLIGLVSMVGSFVEVRWQDNKKKRAIEQAELLTVKAQHERDMLEAENVRKTKELEEARDLQLSMLPKTIPKLPNLEIAVFMKPATEVGGDYYDFHLAGDNTLTIAIGDATGHGAKAGTMVTAAKSMFTVLTTDFEILEILQRINQTIRQMNLGNLYMSLTLAKFVGNQLQITSAGMPPTLVYRTREKKVEEIFLKSMPLGAHDHFPFKDQKIELYPGDTILLMTDGFPELFNPRKEIFDYTRAKQCFEEVAERSPQEIINHLFNSAENWRNDRPQEDDITFVALRFQKH